MSAKKSQPPKKVKPWQKAYQDKLAGMTHAQIAEKYGVSPLAVKSWSARHWKQMQEQDAIDAELNEGCVTDATGMQKPLVTIAIARGRNPDKAAFAGLVAKNIEDTKPAKIYAEYSRENLPKLEPRQERFVEEYLLDLCGQDAAIRAGYAITNATSTGAILLAKPEIQAHIQTALAERRKRTGTNIDRATQELNCIANANLMDIVDSTGNIRPDVSREAMAAVKSIKTKRIPQKNGPPIIETQIEIFDKIKADELQAKINGWLIERRQVQANITYDSAEEVAAKIEELIRKRAEDDANIYDTTATIIDSDADTDGDG